MDPITVLQSRIEQLEAKLGLAATANAHISENQPQGDPVPAQYFQGDSATTNLLNAAQSMNNATAGMEKLPKAMNMANELNNYTDPNLVQNIQQNAIHTQELAAAEQAIRHHCQCMHRCKQVAPVMESEQIQQVPQMQEAVNDLQAKAVEVKEEAESVCQGVQEIAETCGQAATNASEQLADVAQKVDEVEQKMFPRRRNGLD